MKIPDSYNKQAIFRYTYVVIFIGIIYSTLPLARSISKFLRSHDLLTATIYLIIFIFILSCAILIFRYLGFRLLYFILVVIFFITYGFVVETYDILVEKIHFVEYGILAFLLYIAIKTHIRSFLIYPLSFIIIFFIGWGDEGIQFILPDRCYDFRDVVLNALSGGLMLALIFMVETLKAFSPNLDRIDKSG